MSIKYLYDYKSPIDMITTNMKKEVNDGIYRAVVDMGIKVNKAELIRALEYDRGQYQKGYDDAMRSLVHCKWCEYAIDEKGCCKCVRFNDLVDRDGFCSYGERRYK